jgi:hypothetical protein
MKCLHRHIVADLRVILVKFGPAKYSFYMDLESDCVIFRHMRLFVQKLKHTRNYISFRRVDFRNGVYLTKSMQKYYFYVRCSNCSVTVFCTTYIHLFTCNIPF